MNQKTEDMFAAPVNTTEKQMTTVENNGHAMAPYMMSVALWVGCIAFSLMYPLTKIPSVTASLKPGIYEIFSTVTGFMKPGKIITGKGDCYELE